MWRPQAWSPRTTWLAMVSALLIVVGLELMFAATTRALEFNDGYGYLDGQTYSAMVRMLRGELEVPVLSPYVYRILPIAVIAFSGASLTSAFLALNLAAFALCGPLLILLARHYQVPTAIALLSILWWAALPAGPRFAWYYPTLLDGVGHLATVALLVCAVYGRFAIFAALLPLAVLTRESVLAVIPVLWLANRQLGFWSTTRLTLLAALPGILAYATVRVAPPIAPATGMTALQDIGQNLAWFRENAAGRAWRFFVTPWLTLGLLPFVALASWQRGKHFVVRNPEWAAYLAAVGVLALIGGGDYDRFAYWAAPALLIMSAVAAGRVSRSVAICLTVVHLVATRAWMTLGTSEDAYRESVVALMSANSAALWALLIVTCVLVAATILRISTVGVHRGLGSIEV